MMLLYMLCSLATLCHYGVEFELLSSANLVGLLSLASQLGASHCLGACVVGHGVSADFDM